MTVYQLLIALKNTPSLKSKEALLRDNSSDILKSYLTLALSPRVVFNVSKAPEQTTEGSIDSTAMVVRRLAHIIQDGLRGKDLESCITECMKNFTKESYYVFSRALEKDLDCNVGSTIVNKVWPGLIPDHPYQGAKSDTTANRVKVGIEKGCMAQEKCDGMYCDMVNAPDGVTVFTRIGNTINMDGQYALLREVSLMPHGVYQGELRVRDLDSGNYLPRHIGNGMIRKGLKGGVIELPELALLTFCAWDYISDKSAWEAGKFSTPYSTRFTALMENVNNVWDSCHVSVVYSRQVSSWPEAANFYGRILARGGEGAIIKRLDGKWKSGKPSWQVKMKVEESCDMLVVGVKPHSKRPGCVGALEVRSFGDEPLMASCGGLMDEAQEHDAAFWVGKVVRMKYNALSPYGRFDHPRVDNGVPPVWDACIRESGSKPNTAEEIKENYKRATGVEV